VDEAILELALDHDPLADGDQRAVLACTAEIDQRAAGRVGHHELVAVDLGDGAADRDDAVRLERSDRDRCGRRHRHAGTGSSDGDRTCGTAHDQQASGGKSQAIAPETEAAGRA
jgi:hypothetical protein